MDEIRAAVERAVRKSLVGGGGEWNVLLPDGSEVGFSFRSEDGTTKIRGDDGQVEHRFRVCVVVE